jgi:Domain of unknown function (DUF4926)
VGTSSAYWHRIRDNLSAVFGRQGGIAELAVVELAHDVKDFPVGAVGRVVAAHPEDDAYVVEMTDRKGRTLDLLPCRSDDLRPATLA